MVKRRSGEHQAVNEGDRDTNLDSLPQGPEHPARGRTVEKKLPANAYMDRWDHVRLPVHDKAYMADQTLVQDRIDRGTVINPALGETSESGSIGARHLVHRRGRS
jgi:hypothetical protein